MNQKFTATTNIANAFKMPEPRNRFMESKVIAQNDKKKQEETIEPEKIKKPRLKLDEKTLLYSENGLKKFYEIAEKTEFREKSGDINNLNKLITLFKNWHFMCFPKYDTEFFISKITELGKKPSTKAYMSRLRKIYKGEATWEVLYNQQDEIMTNPHLINKKDAQNNNSNSPVLNKTFVEDNKSGNPSAVKSTNLNLNFDLNRTNLTSQLNSVSFNNKVQKKEKVNNAPSVKKDVKNDENSEVQELDFDDVYENEEIAPDVNDNDYDNFDHFYENSNYNQSQTNSVYKREKRLYSDAFSKSIDAKSLDDKSIFSQTSKKFKFNS